MYNVLYQLSNKQPNESKYMFIYYKSIKYPSTYSESNYWLYLKQWKA